MALSDLSFERGHEFEQGIRKEFNVPINNVEGSKFRDFIMVVAFERSKIRLNDDSVGLILQSCFGGSSNRFHTSRLMNLSFKFSVSCKSVGFTIIRGGNMSIRFSMLNSFFGAMGVQIML